MTPPKVAVFGAGLIGTQLGGMLAAVADVTLIGRARLLDQLADGLRLTDVDGLDRQVPPTALQRSTDPGAMAGADIILVTVKSLATAEAAAAIARHAPAGAPVLSFQNGVSNADRLRAELPGRTVLAGMVPYNVAAPAPGHLHRGTGGVLKIADDPAIAPWLARFAEAGVPLEVASDMNAILWGKLLVNLNNAINALSGLPLAEQLADRDFRRAWAVNLDEGLRLVRAARIAPVDPLPMPLVLLPQILRLPDRLYRFVVAAGSGGRARVDRRARSSMADDLAQGRRTEIDYLQGELVRLASRLGRSAPVSARLVELVRAAEAGAPPLSGRSLRQMLAEAARRRG